MRAEQPGALPGTVLDVISYRIAPARAGQPGRAAGRAVAGASFSVGVVAQMLGVAVLALLDPVDECQAAAFLVAGDRPGDYRFSHALVRSAVVAQLSAADQRRWHVAAADAIERLYQGQLRPHLAELAHQLVAGSLPGDRLDAARACQAAGKAAAEDLGFEEAARHDGDDRLRHGRVLPPVVGCAEFTGRGGRGPPRLSAARAQSWSFCAKLDFGIHNSDLRQIRDLSFFYDSGVHRDGGIA